MNPSAASARCEGRSPEDELMDDWLFLSSDSASPPSPEVSRSQETEDREDRGQLKSKLISAWNSVKYGWSLKQRSKFSKSSAVIMFGQSYELRDHDEKERFRRSFASRLWLTYRRGFPQLEGCSLTTDSGWGCVLRTGQMLLAQGLLLHLMPPGWTWSVSPHAVKDDMDLPAIRPTDGVERALDAKEEPNERGRKLSLGSLLDRPMEATHRRVASWFADQPTAPFGIHQLVQLGKSSGKKAGDWYGPSIAAHILRKAMAASADLPNLVVYVAQDCTIYLEDVKRLCEQPFPQPWKSVIILVPVRLGGQDLNPSYITCVKKLLTLQCCIGIIGGKPKHSLFFVGFQDDHVLYLDPHYCQPTVDIAKENFPLESFHCKYPRKMSFSRMDPSCTIGFYAKGQMDFESLCTAVNEALSISAETYPMFIFAEGKSQEEEGTYTPPNITYIQRQNERRSVDTSSSMDEFVLL
ncbi:cysteine protease ATG4D-like [Anarrhichthys ocellatus]|uniref:cysteine protease ATG4D-like n=1 Tax=Anarrhichthys ocellatus TaxID=433405 RepID=UPI0012EE6522|nr:cysteine protease ATG4D-like [Anarrhichthys ocellatus]XP_031726642.1 cysteine protease ATG4D-like [Anarrhichthys ocellatus]